MFYNLGLKITTETKKCWFPWSIINYRLHSPYRKPNGRPPTLMLIWIIHKPLWKKIYHKALTKDLHIYLAPKKEKKFNEAVKPYNEALKNGYNQVLILIKIRKMLVVNRIQKQMIRKKGKKKKCIVKPSIQQKYKQSAEHMSMFSHLIFTFDLPKQTSY